MPAVRWRDFVCRRGDSLDFLPGHCPLAEEDALRPYEIRRLIYGRHPILFTIDEPAAIVYVIGLRHGAAGRGRTRCPRR